MSAADVVYSVCGILEYPRLVNKDFDRDSTSTKDSKDNKE